MMKRMFSIKAARVHTILLEDINQTRASLHRVITADNTMLYALKAKSFKLIVKQGRQLTDKAAYTLSQH